ncbi:MAG: hypothetical protein P4L59_12655 [Desulfosporosinus sp.]|nr:hypothetical protein [Desulfosporosinus sp.]
MSYKMNSGTSYRWLSGKTVTLPVNKTRIIALFLALNYLIILLDITTAHIGNHFSNSFEWIPIIFSPIAIVTSLILFLKDKSAWSMKLHMWVNAIGVLIGIFGFIFHISGLMDRASFTLSNLVGGNNPVFAPLAFVGTGIIGVIIAQKDKPLANNSSKNILSVKTRQLLLAISFWFFTTGLDAFFEHAQTSFTNLLTWVPIIIGLFGAMVCLMQVFTPSTDTASITLLTVTMILCFIIGLLGFFFHISSDLSNAWSWNSLFYQAPWLAPLLFSDLGIWGMIVILEPIESY